METIFVMVFLLEFDLFHISCDTWNNMEQHGTSIISFRFTPKNLFLCCHSLHTLKATTKRNENDKKNPLKLQSFVRSMYLFMVQKKTINYGHS